MEGWIARWYARTRGADLESFRREATEVADQLPRGAHVLEVAPGPGFFSIELARLGDFRITGLDISQAFVEIARDGARRAGVSVDFRSGNASAMPLAGESFDFVYCSAAFKNFAEPIEALDEMHRVLRPGGRAVIHDLRKDVSLAEIDTYIARSGRKRFDAWLTRWAFRTMLVKRAYTLDALRDLVRHTRFGACQIATDELSFRATFLKPAAVAALAG
ncbi:MAG TPA: class I SAM-dependent methyltransferase [Pirellulales bacterium]|nr:class I SAM-dependent methyltransferase [Pirellulales bacterium]